MSLRIKNESFLPLPTHPSTSFVLANLLSSKGGGTIPLIYITVLEFLKLVALYLSLILGHIPAV